MSVWKVSSPTLQRVTPWQNNGKCQQLLVMTYASSPVLSLEIWCWLIVVWLMHTVTNYCFKTTQIRKGTIVGFTSLSAMPREASVINFKWLISANICNSFGRGCVQPAFPCNNTVKLETDGANVDVIYNFRKQRLARNSTILSVFKLTLTTMTMSVYFLFCHHIRTRNCQIFCWKQIKLPRSELILNSLYPQLPTLWLTHKYQKSRYQGRFPPKRLYLFWPDNIPEKSGLLFWQKLLFEN